LVVLEPGECGALVITSDTYQAVGHVVSSNPLGEVCLVPLKDTISQINRKYQTLGITVSFPENIREPASPSSEKQFDLKGYTGPDLELDCDE
jgi:hypothetical protein